MHVLTLRRPPAIIGCLALLAAGGLIAGCGDDDSDDAASAAPARFAIAATAQDGKPALTVPATVKAGLVTISLKNTDKRPRSAGLVRIVGDHTVDEVVEVTSSSEGEPIPQWLQDGGGVGAVAPGATAAVTQVLAPGRYAVTDDETASGDGEGPTNAQRGATGEFTVTGPASDAELPEQPATLTATDDGKEYGFAFEGLKAGTNRIRFENTGKQLHHAVLFPINKGSTFADAKKAFASDAPPKGPPPVDFSKAVGTQVIDGGIAQNITLDLAAGSYAVACFITDRKGGKPHVEKGMIDELVVK